MGVTTGPNQEIQSDTPTPPIDNASLMPAQADTAGQSQIPMLQPSQPSQPAQPQPRPQPEQPKKPGSFFHNITHAFAGALFGQAIEDGPDKGKRVGGTTGEYTAITDPNTGEIKMAPIPMTVGQRMQGLASRMLSGLANVPDTPENPSPIKGFGEGFKGVQDAKAAQMKQSKEAAEENFKREQEMKMQKYDIAYKNMATQRMGVELMKMRNDMNPIIPESRAIMEAVKNSPDLAGWQVQEVTQSQLNDMMKDGHFSNSQILQLGSQPMMDGDQPRLNPDGTPMSEMHYGLVTGPAGSQHAGNIVIPKEIASEFKDFGAKVGQPNLKSFEEGSEMPIRKFVQTMGLIDDYRAKVVAGWNVPKIALAPDGKTPVMINSFDQSLPPRPLSYLPIEAQKEILAGDKEAADAYKLRGEGINQRAQAAAYAGGLLGGAVAPGTPAYKTMWNGVQDAINRMPNEMRSAVIGLQHQVSPQSLMALMTVANGDGDITKIFPTSPRKGVPLITAQEAVPYLKLINPEWSEQLYGEKQKAINDFAASADGQAIGSFNRFMAHAAELKKVAENFANTKLSTGMPIMNTPLNELQNRFMGEPGVPGLIAAIAAPREEWQSFLRNGHVSDMAGNEEARKILDPSSTPAQVLDALRVMASQAVARLDTLDEQYSRSWGGHYSGLVTRAGAAAADELGLGSMIDQYRPYIGKTVGGVYSNQPQPQSRPQQQMPRAWGNQGSVYTDDGGKTWFNKDGSPYQPPR